MDYAFERVEIFLRVKGRLPTEKGDRLTQNMLNKYCRGYEQRSLKPGRISLEYLYNLIRDGKIKPLEKRERKCEKTKP